MPEALQLRVKDIDFHYNQIFVRDSKGEKDRTTMLEQKVVPSLKNHLNKIKKVHQEDLKTFIFTLCNRKKIPKCEI